MTRRIFNKKRMKPLSKNRPLGQKMPVHSNKSQVEMPTKASRYEETPNNRALRSKPIKYFNLWSAVENVSFQRISRLMCLLMLGLVDLAYAQTITEVEPNNTVANALANAQHRIYQPSTLSGTVSSGDDDIWLIGYDFSEQIGDGRLWMFFNGKVPSGLTVTRGNINTSVTAPYVGSESFGPANLFTECPNFDYTSFFDGRNGDSYTYLKISSSDGATRNYSLQVVDGATINICGFSSTDPQSLAMAPCTTPTAPSLAGITRTGTSTMRLNDFPAVNGADGYIVQISDNGSFSAIPSQYDEPFTGSVTTVYGGSGSQVVANVTSPMDIDVTGLSQGTNYTFKVTPYVNCLSYYQMGTASTTSASPTCGVIPNAPASVTATSATPTSLTLESIGASSGGATGYITYINTSNSFTPPNALPSANTTYNSSGQQAIAVGTSTSPNVQITGSAITTGGTYYIRSYAYELCGSTYYFDPTGTVASIQVCAGTPAAPSVLSLTNVSHSSLNVSSISPVGGASGYVVMANTSDSFTPPADGTSLPMANAIYGGSGQQVVYAGASSSPAVAVSGLDNANGGATYYFKAYAYTLCEGNYYFGSNGATATATTLGAVQTVASNAIFYEVGDSFMDLFAFTGATGATGHVIKINATNTFTAPADGLGSLPASNTNYTGGEQVVYAGTAVNPNIRITGLSASTTYYFTIYTYSVIDGAIFYNQTGYEFSQQNVKPAPGLSLPDFSKTYGDDRFVPSASSNSSGAIAYEVIFPSSTGTSSSQDTITVGVVGTATIRVTQAADANYNPDTIITTMTINKADPIIEFNPVTVDFGAGVQTLSASSLKVGTAGSISTGTISYNIEGVAPSGNTLSGANNATWTPGEAGTFTIRASITADGNYNAGFQDALFSVSAPAKNYFLSNSKLFRLSNGGVTTARVDFSANPTATGSSPVEIKLINGEIWGITSSGGSGGKGVLFRFNDTDSTFSIVGEFTSATANTSPFTIEQINNQVWVVASFAGSGSTGALYKANTDGTGFTEAHAFSTDLLYPTSSLALFGGKIYGTCRQGGTNNKGGVFSINEDGSGYAVELNANTYGYPLFGGILHDNLIWFCSATKLFEGSGTSHLVGFNPVTQSVDQAIGLGDDQTVQSLTVVNNDIYGITAKNSSYRLVKTSSPYVGITGLYTFTTGDDIKFNFNASSLTYDGQKLIGIGQNTSANRGVVYSINLDGTGLTDIYRSTSENFSGTYLRDVSRLTPVLTFDNQNIDHLGTSTLAASTNSSGAITYELISDATSSTLVGDQFTAGNVGSVTVRATLAEDANFDAATQDATITIQKITPDFQINDITQSFGSAVVSLAPSSTNYVGGTVTYQFVDGGSLSSTGPNTGSTIAGDQLTLGTPGTETIRATLSSTANFNATTVDFQLTVTNATADLSAFTDFTKEFFTADSALAISSASGIAVTYQLLTSNTGSSLNGNTLKVGNVAGTETLRVTVTEPNYNATTKDITLTVAKATPVVTWATPADIQFSIEALDTDRLNATANVPGTFDYWLDEVDLGTQIIAGTTTLPATGTRTLAVRFEPTDNANYASTIQTVEITITLVNLEITVNNDTIAVGEADPTFTYSITNGSLLSNHEMYVPLIRDVGNAVGSYSINLDPSSPSPWNDPEGFYCNGLCIRNGRAESTANSNYNITFVPGTLTINYLNISDQAVTANPTSGLCEVSSAVSLASSQSEVAYYLKDDANDSLLAGPISGTGSGISFPALTFNENTTTNVLAVPEADPRPFSLQFDDADGYVSLASPQSQLNADAITVETWANIPTTDDTDQNMGIITNAFDGGTVSYSIYLSNGTMYVGFYDGVWHALTYASYPRDQWIHIASTYDRNTIRLYINGTEVETLAETTSLPTTNTISWRLGRLWYTPFTSQHMFGGALANTRIWNVARTAAEINATKDTVLTSATGLVASYTYANGAGNTVTDITGNGFDGTLQNMEGNTNNWKTSVHAVEMTTKPAVTVNSIQDQMVLLAEPTSSTPIVSLSSSQVGINYSLRNDADNSVLQSGLAGTGSSIAFGAQSISENTTFNVLAESASGSCSLEMGNTVLATPLVPVTISFNSSSLTQTFDSTQQVVTIASVDTTAGGTISPLPTLITTYKGVNGTTYDSSTSAPIAAGQYEVISSIDTTGVTYRGSITDTLTIERVALTVSADKKSKVYGDADPALTYSITSGALVGADTLTGALTRQTGDTVSTYVIQQGTLSSNSNYVLSYTQDTLIISARPITITADAKSKVYGDTDPIFTAQLTSGNFIGNDTLSGNLTRAVGDSVAKYPITQGTLTAGVNYSLTYLADSLTITAKAITVTADAKSKTYGDSDPMLTYQVNPALESGDMFTGALNRESGNDVGKYQINQNDLSAGSNYDLTYVADSLTIGTKAITVTADAKSKTYGDTDPSLTYQVSPALESGDMFTGSLNREAGNDVGEYQINQNDLSAGLNYDLTYVADSLTIGAKAITVTADAKSKTYGDADPDLTYQVSPALESGDMFTGSLNREAGNDVGKYQITQNDLSAGMNYDLTYVADSLTITAKSITVTADAKSKTYGDANPALTYQVSPALESGDMFTGSLDREVGNDVGKYQINQNDLSAGMNYDLTYVADSLTIGAKVITVTADAKSKTYGDADPSLTYHVSPALESGDMFTGSLNREAGNDVGKYQINQNDLSAGSNYDLTYVSDSLTIGAKAITVTADAKSKTYGDADPALTYQVSPALESGDMFTGSLNRDSGNDVGKYQINQNDLSAGMNYDLSYVADSLTITAKAITVTADAKSKTYGDADPDLTYQVSPALESGDMFTGGLDREVGNDVGKYQINQNDLSAGMNYDLTYVADSLTIGAKVITVTADAKSKTYGDADPSLTYQVSPALESGDMFTGSLNREAGNDVGKYQINQNDLSAGSNYDLTYVSDSLTITQATQVITFGSLGE